jgi:hypothetical protein
MFEHDEGIYKIEKFFCLEEYAVLYGEYETERRRNMDLTEARDRLADHIKILSDELGDREVLKKMFIYLKKKIPFFF